MQNLSNESKHSNKNTQQKQQTLNMNNIKMNLSNRINKTYKKFIHVYDDYILGINRYNQIQRELDTNLFNKNSIEKEGYDECMKML